MPIHRYEIRNEYSLADPDLYRAADKDDPEALLEGVAMAGLVGLLRQLGDLAEFAAEIFHDLHEEVMATSARGHGLMIRVQQLESEIPSIEKAFLSQTDHSSFFYSAGVDWRSNLRVDQNLVTQGDLPRFIMDSYEECRGPPRLFLLDKFDVAGAGACLKRFTDPSFFKVENAADVQREKKIRKTKKKGPRWRNGGTPEVLPSAHAKLHQLFLEERVENGVTNPSNPARRVKLKRRLNGFPFDSRTGKSYMEKVLQNPSPEHTIHEVSMSSALMVLHTNDHTESDLDVVEFEQVSPRKDSMEREISLIMPNSSTYEQNEVFRNDKVLEVSNSYPSTVSDETSYALDNANDEKDIHVGGEGKTEGSIGYESDGISCEIDNYVDAPSTMGSEVDTDSELRGKSDLASPLVKTQSSYVNEDIQTRSSDSHSTTEPTLSDEGNNSSKKETSSFSSSGSPGNSAENAHPDKLLSERSSSADNDLVDDASSYQKTSDGDFSVDRHLSQCVPDYSCSNKDKITSPRSDIEQLPSSLLCSGDSVPILSQSDSEEAVREDSARASEIEDVVLMLNAEDRKKVIDPLCPPSVLDPEFQLGNEDDDSNMETQPYMSTVSEITGHRDSSGAQYSDLLHEDDSDDGELTQVENAASSNMSNSFFQSRSDVPETNFNDVPEANFNDVPVAGKLYGEGSGLTEKIFSKCPDVAINDVVTLSREEVFEGDKLSDKIDVGDSNIFDEDSKWVSYHMEASHDKELGEASLSNAEEHHSHNSIDKQVGSENIILPSAEYSPDWPEEVSDSHDRDVVEEELTMNETCNDIGLQGSEVTVDLLTNDSADIERSNSTPEILEEGAGLVNSVQDDGINLHTEPIGVKIVNDLVSGDIKSFNDYDCEDEQLDTADADSTNAYRNDSVTVGPHKWVEANTPEISAWNELQDDSDSLWESQREPGLLEEEGRGEAASSGSTTRALSYDTENGHLKLQESDRFPNPDVDSFPKPEVDSNVTHSPNFVDGITTELLQVQRSFDREQEASQQSVSMPVSEIGEELVSEEEIELQNNQLNEELLDCQSGQSPILVADPQKMPDHADGRKEESNCGSVFSLVNYPSPPSFPPSNVSYETNEISLDELPPLPPLPPVQWRMGKLLQASFTTSESEEIMMNHESLTPITSLPNGFTNAITTSEQQIDQTLVQITPEIASKEEELEHEVCSADANFMNVTTELLPGIEAQPTKPTNAISSLVDTPHSQILIDLENAPNGEKLENALNTEKVEGVCILDKKIDLQPEIDKEEQHPMSSHSDVSSSTEGMNGSSVKIDLETKAEQQKVQPSFSSSVVNAEQQKVQPSSSSSEASAVPETKIIPLKVENEQLKLLLPFTARELPVPPVEDGVSNGIRLKVPRAPNPLFENVAALDKSKLRKVTERVRPQIQKVDERDSLLEQIRTKSFNLKPASASRPSIQGPRTNLKVAAILEKANQIRQAFAGSDEDDEDNWSDS